MWVTHLVCIQEMSKFEEPDILFNMLNCLKILCLHGECLYLARKDHPQFLAYIQEKMLIPRCVLTDCFNRKCCIKLTTWQQFGVCVSVCGPCWSQSFASWPPWLCLSFSTLSPCRMGQTSSGTSSTQTTTAKTGKYDSKQVRERLTVVYDWTVNGSPPVCSYNMLPKPLPAHISPFCCHGYLVAQTGGKEELWD